MSAGAVSAVRVGQVWRDRDPRCLSGKRFCKVAVISDGRATMVACREDGTPFHSLHVSRVSLRRFHRWELVRDAV